MILSDILQLGMDDLVLLAGICFFAGLVRGFSGFALSAVVMASAVAILPPIHLIPLLWFVEMAASLMMARGGFRDADTPTAMTLVAGNWIGWPIGLSLTLALPVATSKTVALIVILTLAALQLGKVRLPALTSRAGTFLTGLVAGTVTGLAHVGGMVVALYALARGRGAREIRGTLVVFLFVSAFGGMIYLLWFGVMTSTAALRGLALIAPTLLGVWIGTRFFNPALERHYKTFCLILLIGLAAIGLARQVL